MRDADESGKRSHPQNYMYTTNKAIRKNAVISPARVLDGRAAERIETIEWIDRNINIMYFGFEFVFISQRPNINFNFLALIQENMLGMKYTLHFSASTS